MTNQPFPPSLSGSTAETHDHSSSDTNSHVHSHTHSHTHTHSSRFRSSHTHLFSRSTENHDPDVHTGDDTPSQPAHHSDSDDDSVENANELVVTLEERQDDSNAPFVTRVIQTISLVQVVDTAGLPIATQTHYAPPGTVVLDPSSGATVSAIPPSSEPSAAPVPDPAASDNVPPSSSLTASIPPPPPTEPTSTSASLPSPQLSSSQTMATSSETMRTSDSSFVTPTVPLTTASVYPSLSASGVLNSTSVTSESEVFTSTTASNDRISGSLSSSISYPSDSTTFATTSYSSTSSSWTSTSTSIQSDDSAGDFTVAGGQPEATSPSGDGDSGNSGGGGGGIDLSERDKQIVGGVVGSIAGVAFLALIFLILVKRKRRKRDVQELLGDNTAQSRSLPSGPGGGSGSGSGDPMTERTALFGVSAATASLAGLGSKRKAQETQPSGTGERGFVRVSGKKLPSVLQHGGDGYSDPRESMTSGVSSTYGSQVMDPNTYAANRLAVGRPMRPVSGVPVTRSGPAHTPVIQRNPFADPPSPPPRPPRTPTRFTSPERSRGSPSKFQEAI